MNQLETISWNIIGEQHFDLEFIQETVIHEYLEHCEFGSYGDAPDYQSLWEYDSVLSSMYDEIVSYIVLGDPYKYREEVLSNNEIESFENGLNDFGLLLDSDFQNVMRMSALYFYDIDLNRINTPIVSVW